MKRTFKSLAVAMALLVGISSCSKETPAGGEEKGKGKLEINFSFDGTRAAKSDNVIPATSWSKNIKSMKLVLAQSGTIKDVRDIDLQTTNNAIQINRVFTGVVAGSYDVYIVANYNQTTTPFGAGAVTASPSMTGLVNTPIASFLMNLNAAAGVVGTDPAGSVLKGEPAEIFLAKSSGIVVPADGVNTTVPTLNLTRAVSLVRVRINQNFTTPEYDNSKVKFTTANQVNFRIRRHGTGLGVNAAAYTTTFPAAPYGVSDITTTSADTKNVLYSGKVFKTATQWTAEKGNYSYGAGEMGLDADWTLWNEYMALPGGSETNGKLKFNIALGGWAPPGYTALKSDGTTVVIGGTGAMVYWAAQVTKELKPNGIMELNIQVKGQGSTDVPPVDDFGSLEINVDLKPWGTVDYADVVM